MQVLRRSVETATLGNRSLNVIAFDLFGQIPGSRRELWKVNMWHDVLSWDHLPLMMLDRNSPRRGLVLDR